jgi:predicted DNA-binding mobile mystery protein A
VNLQALINRKRLDRDLMGLGLEDLIAPPPPDGWVRTIRQALGMSSYEMAMRTGMSPTRMREFEKGEVDGSLRLSVLGRLARALNCTLFYVLVPDEPLELTVWRQARRKASEEFGVAGWEEPGHDDQTPSALVMSAQLDALTLEFIDKRGLWR